MILEPVTRRRRSAARTALLLLGLVLVLCAAAAGSALLWWPQPGVVPDTVALARVVGPGYGGTVGRVVVRRPDGSVVPVVVRNGRLWPEEQIAVGERLAVELTVRRPGWAGWLVGRTAMATLVLRTPRASLRGRWLEVPTGQRVVARFDTPVRAVALRVNGQARTLRFARARAAVDVGIVAAGRRRSGRISIAAAPRTWERLPQPVHLTWFPAGRRPEVLVDPAVGATIAPDRPITLTFSRPMRAIFGAAVPTITPVVPGRWRVIDSHTLSFEPRGLGYPLSGHLAVRLPEPVAVARGTEGAVTRSLEWDVRHGTVLRLEQLLAEAGYLPVDWTPAERDRPPTARTELAATADPPAGRFRWRYANTPHELRALWKTGTWNEIVRGAVMMFEDTHHLDVDAFVGPKVWSALLADTLAGRRRTEGYSYVYVHREVPQSLTLWHDGRTILRSPGNTGVPAAPTQLGTFPVFEHIPIGTMSGTNPDGTRYHDPGIRWISYFNHGDAIHAFNRSSFGTPQSLGCVELPLAAAAKVWPYTPIGTLVTVEN